MKRSNSLINNPLKKKRSFQMDYSENEPHDKAVDMREEINKINKVLSQLKIENELRKEENSQLQTEIDREKKEIAELRMKVEELESFKLGALEMFNIAAAKSTQPNQTKPHERSNLPTLNLFFDKMSINNEYGAESTWGNVFQYLQSHFNVLHNSNESIQMKNVINVYFLYKSADRMENMWDRESYEYLYKLSNENAILLILQVKDINIPPLDLKPWKIASGFNLPNEKSHIPFHLELRSSFHGELSNRFNTDQMNKLMDYFTPKIEKKQMFAPQCIIC